MGQEPRFAAVAVFVDAKVGGLGSGNPLLVFPDGGAFTTAQMSTIARAFGHHLGRFSETVFVADASTSAYSSRIFTPLEELPFAGHPTLGTAWLLRHLGAIEGEEVHQHTAAGVTTVRFSGDTVWFRRRAHAAQDLRVRDQDVDAKVARALGIERAAVGLEPRELGRSVSKLNPAVIDAGIPQLLVPVRDREALRRCRAVPEALAEVPPGHGAYCFTATRAGAIEARGMYPGLGIEEDPATGSAAASLGIYLADRLGPIELEIAQGVQIGRSSKLLVSAREGEVDVGGRCGLLFESTLATVP